MKKEMRTRLLEAYKAAYHIWNDSEAMAKYATGKILVCFELRGKLIPIEKCRIETKFPFGYDYPLGNDTFESALTKASFARTSEHFFKKLNHTEAPYSKLIDTINKSGKKWIARPMYSKELDNEQILYCITEKDENRNYEDGFELTKKELFDYRKTLARCAKKHHKNIEAYLKKYGLTRVEAWTYDRLD